MQGGRRRPGCPFVGFALCAVERILADSTVRVYLRHMSPEETNPSGVSRYAENCEFHGTAKSGLDAERRISGRLSAIRLGRAGLQHPGDFMGRVCARQRVRRRLRRPLAAM